MQDDDVVRPMRPRGPRAPSSRGRGSKWRGRLLLIVLPLLLVSGSLLRFWVDLLWFGELGQRDVLVTRLQWGTAMGLAFGLLTAVFLYVNFFIARRVARDDLYVPFLAPGADPEAPEQPVVPHFVLKPVLLGAAVLGGVLSGLIMSSRWETVLRFLGRSDFGVTDPHFGKDASFYVFTMPLLEMVARYLQTLVVFTIVGVLMAYMATGVVRYVPVLRIARPAIVHMAALVAAFLLASAFQFRLSIWNLATSTRGVVAGAGWTDTHARIPAFWLMIVASVVLAAVVLWFARRERWRVVGGAVIGWVALSVVATGIVPSLVQNVLVEPNELTRERKLIEGNIRNTREGFDLKKIESRPYRDAASLSEQQLLRGNRGTTDNIRLWSPDVLEKVINQLQSLRRYYGFLDVDVDRYDVDGRYRQVMLSVRELDPAASTVAQSWVSQRMVYTHGYGAVAAWPNEVATQGRPEFLLQDLPPRAVGQDDITLERPEVYFGEAPDNPVIVGTKQEEISPRAAAEGADESGTEAGGAAAARDDEEAAARAEAGTDERTRYEGDGGIRITNLARRVAFATTFGDARILFTGQLTKDSRILFRRNVVERVTELAPFLQTDRDPYAVVHDGRLVWIVDAYTTSDQFPYSEYVTLDSGVGTRDVNYVRNSVKAVVDAYDGDVTLYVVDEDDAILRAWRDIFPDLFTPLSKMPDQLRAHLRYPEDLFELQTAFWTRYHMDKVRDFYAREDLWQVPQLGGQEMEAFYVLARLPGEEREELLLVRPLTPAGKKNMVAYMVARSDGERYGELITLQLPTQSLTQGPAQVQALIKQDSDIAEQVRFWESGSNEVIFGNLLVLPIERSLLYVQPVYLQNAEAEIPEFQRIVVVLGDTVAWGETFETAVADLLARRGDEVQDQQDELEQDRQREQEQEGGPAPDDGAPDTPAPDADAYRDLSEAELQQLLAEVSAAYDRAVACQRRGDTVCYARELEAVEQLLADAADDG